MRMTPTRRAAASFTERRRVSGILPATRKMKPGTNTIVTKMKTAMVVPGPSSRPSYDNLPRKIGEPRRHVGVTQESLRRTVRRGVHWHIRAGRGTIELARALEHRGRSRGAAAPRGALDPQQQRVDAAGNR